MFLSSDDITILTGYVQPAAQIRWLQRFGIRHFVRADGRPIVMRTALEEAAPERRPSAPNFDAMRTRH